MLIFGGAVPSIGTVAGDGNGSDRCIGLAVPLSVGFIFVVSVFVSLVLVSLRPWASSSITIDAAAAAFCF